MARDNDTTRATAITQQDGVDVKTGALTRLFLGTIYTSGANTTEDSFAKRYVSNRYNAVLRPMSVIEATNSWTYTTATFRQMNNSAANQLDYVACEAGRVVRADVAALVGNSSAISVTSGIGVDSATVNSAQIHGKNIGVVNGIDNSLAAYRGIPGLGRHTLKALEFSEATGTTTWYGDVNLPTYFQAGIHGEVMG